MSLFGWLLWLELLNHQFWLPVFLRLCALLRHQSRSSVLAYHWSSCLVWSYWLGQPIRRSRSRSQFSPCIWYRRQGLVTLGLGNPRELTGRRGSSLTPHATLSTRRVRSSYKGLSRSVLLASVLQPTVVFESRC